MGKDEFVWGFSSNLTFIAATMEGLWLIGCFATWVVLHRCSKLVRSNRTGAGTIRNIIDVADGIRRVLGDKTSVYTESELRKALETCPAMGYVIEERDGLSHIRMAEMPQAAKRRISLDVDFDRKYG
jgi:hypothetical protein